MKQPPGAQIAGWLSRQRWFAGRASAISAIDLQPLGPPHETDDLGVLPAVVSVSDAHSNTDHYLLPLAYCAQPGVSADPIHSGDVQWFDALEHPQTARIALATLLRPATAVATTWLDDEALDLAEVTPLQADQSNTSIRAGNHLVKVIRRLRPGVNPEVELGQALATTAAAVQLAGWSTLTLVPGTAEALVVHRFVDGTDGFALATADAARAGRGQPEDHFPGAAYELGLAIGSIHDQLAEAFGSQTTDDFAAELSARLLRRLDALSDLRVLDPYIPAATSIFGDLARVSEPLPVQRIHGDLHLGQTIFTGDGWRIFDFEGEPRRTIEDRRLPDTPLRDLAGMLRSFDYAVRWNGAASQPGGWERRTSELFLEGYALSGGQPINRQVLDALILDKALYEVGYEATYRPEQVRIPLAAVAALCGSA